MRRARAAVLPAAAWVWLAILVAAPLTLTAGVLPVATLAVYRSASALCHQKPERSFAVARAQMPVCARCFGLYTAGALGALAHLGMGRRRSAPSAARARAVLAAAAVPVLLSVGFEWIGVMHGSNESRFLSGLPLGMAAGWLLQQLVTTDESMLDRSYA